MSALNSESGSKSSDWVDESYCFIHGGAKSYKREKWWLNNHGHGGFFSNDRMNFSGPEVKRVNSSDAKIYEEESLEKKLIDEYYAAFAKNDSSRKFSGDCSVEDSNAYSMDYESFGSAPGELAEKLSSDLDSHWIERKKIEPWWQTADNNDIGLNVSQGSSPHSSISKFDLVEKGSADEGLNFIKETNISSGNLASVALRQEDGPSVIKSMVQKQALAQCLHQEPRGTFSSNSFNSAKVVSSTPSSVTTSESNLRRAELLEALCHSQTRAREAEKLAQVACDEKDHMINLFFQQASCLFAYRQWFHLLQLETICLHLKSNNQAKSLTSPNLSSWPHSKGKTSKKNHGRPKCSVRKFAIAFAVGVSLAGAGFLVGWTIGWFFPAF